MLKLANKAQEYIPHLVWLIEGRTPWEVFFDRNFLGNSRVDRCSELLKRRICDKWVLENCNFNVTTIYVGITFDEIHRIERLKPLKLPWRYEAPLCSKPAISKWKIFEFAKAEGLKIPRLYKLGFTHNNCGGFCIKAGKSHFEILHNKLPDRYKYHENKELEIQSWLNQDVTILREVKNGEKVRLPLVELRSRLTAPTRIYTEDDISVDDSCKGLCFFSNDVDEPHLFNQFFENVNNSE